MRVTYCRGCLTIVVVTGFGAECPGGTAQLPSLQCDLQCIRVRRCCLQSHAAFEKCSKAAHDRTSQSRYASSSACCDHHQQPLGPLKPGPCNRCPVALRPYHNVKQLTGLTRLGTANTGQGQNVSRLAAADRPKRVLSLLCTYAVEWQSRPHGLNRLY